MFRNLFKKPNLPNRSLDDIKKICKILFIDDNEFDVVEILKKAGWNNTKRISDIDSIDSSEIIDNHLLFVDIQGVGVNLRFSDEGLGLVKAIKQKYPEKKVIIYSAISSGNIFHDALSMADARLAKNADPYEFQTLVENFSRDAFSLDECIARIKTYLNKELKINMTSEEVSKRLIKVLRSNSQGLPQISKSFDIKDAGAVASIIRLFLFLK